MTAIATPHHLAPDRRAHLCGCFRFIFGRHAAGNPVKIGLRIPSPQFFRVVRFIGMLADLVRVDVRFEAKSERDYHKWLTNLTLIVGPQYAPSYS